MKSIYPGYLRSLAAAIALITILMLAGTSIVAAQEPAHDIDIDRVAAELEPEIHRTLLAGNIPSATIALVASDHIVWTGAYGHSNLWARTPATPNTVYLIGSTFKTMATVALLQLMEQGKFKLDDRVSDHLAGFKIQNEDPAIPVTFRHLLTHTSGMPADFGPFQVWGDTTPPPLEDYLKSSLKVTGPPMKKVVYSNMAYTLVGYLVQKLSGMPFKQYIEERIFKPLEMRSSAFAPRPDMEERLSIPYTVDTATNQQAPTVRLKASVWPAGIVYGTVTDQANWLILNLNGGNFKGRRIISENMLEQMQTRQHDQFKGPIEGLWGNETAGFGLTWWVADRDGDRYFAHSGSVPGYTAFLLGNRTQKLGFAILTNGNRAHPHLIKLADRAIDLLKKHSKKP
jgi:CubicO group peptidase (beta-lactamase class C family)